MLNVTEFVKHYKTSRLLVNLFVLFFFPLLLYLFALVLILLVLDHVIAVSDNLPILVQCNLYKLLGENPYAISMFDKGQNAC